MGLTPNLGRDALVIDGETYFVLEERGKRRWSTQMVSSQPGDAIAKPYLLAAHGGFGASQRSLLSSGRPSDPSHHDYSLNADASREAIIQPSPRITYLDLSAKTQTARPFRIGGYANSRIGGGRGEIASAYLKRLSPAGYWSLGET